MSDKTGTEKTVTSTDGHDIYPEGLPTERVVSQGYRSDSLHTSVCFPCLPFTKESNDSMKTCRAELPVFVTSDMYNTNHSQRGHALVINQEKFSYQLKKQGYSDRAGSDVDGKNIRKALANLGFQVSYHSNLTASQMKILCKQMAERDHGDSDCFACVLLSHGEDGIVYGTDEAVEIKTITDFFSDSCLTLNGKPKLFFIQACRGSDFDKGVGIDVTDATVQKDADVIKLPVYTDFLFAYSTVPGYYSWRNSRNGSWFIQSLCENIKKYGEELELQKLLMRVNRDVAQKFQSHNPGNADFHQNKQASCSVSMLTKDLYFSRKDAK